MSSTGITPLDYLLGIMRDETADHSDRIDAAKAAAPYVHSKMPIAVVPPTNPDSTQTTADDDHILNLYLNGIHEESDQG